MPTLPNAILCDIDGTLAHMAARSPFDWARVGEDLLDTEIAGMLSLYRSVDPTGARPETRIILLSGRDSVCRGKTQDWLHRYGVLYDQLLMRPEGDNRKDSIVKRELYEQHIKGTYNVRFVLDDRNQVVEMWRSLRLKCLQVAEGNF